MATRLKEQPTYDEDFYAWTQDQARRLRAQARLRQNEPLDWQELAEEVEDLGRSELHTCESLTERIILHLLLLDMSRATDPRAGWEEEITAFRVGLERKLTPSIQRKLVRNLDRHYQTACRLLKARLHRHEPDTKPEPPAGCPYTFQHILGDDD